jgi:hypothetical protein
MQSAFPTFTTLPATGGWRCVGSRGLAESCTVDTTLAGRVGETFPVGRELRLVARVWVASLGAGTRSGERRKT